MTLRSHRPTTIRVGGRSQQSRLVWGLLAASVALNLFLLVTRGGGDDDAVDDPVVDEATDSEATPDGEASTDVEPVTEADAGEPTPAGEVAAVELEDPEEPTPDGETAAKFARIVIDGPVSRGFVRALGSPEGDRLALTAGRVLSWNLDLTKDPRPGDVVEVLYQIEEADPTQIGILALRYRSAKFDKTFEAWRFKPDGWKYPGHFDGDGREVALYLDGGPIREYEQITSLIGDGRGHSGMDFKAPTGTKVYAPFAGTVSRATWNFTYNGTCVEIRTSAGLVRFLHMSELAPEMKAGAKVEAGQFVGLSGNTGRSSAPHLHYEIVNSSGRVIDPLDKHETRHRVLSDADKLRFAPVRVRLAERLDGAAPPAE
jgi:murein DD-endopeptidase